MVENTIEGLGNEVGSRGKEKTRSVGLVSKCTTEVVFALGRNFCHCKDSACVYYSKAVEKTQYVVEKFIVTEIKFIVDLFSKFFYVADRG